MRVAIDARELRGQPTGVGRVLSGILSAWRTLPEAAGHEFVMCSPSPGGAGGGTLWEQFRLPGLIRRARADVLFAPAYTGPLASPVPVVAAVYDVSFAAHPEWFSAREGLRRRLLTGVTARRAATVITSSEFSRREIVQYLGVDPDRIEVAYPGITPAVVSSSSARRDDLVLFVGSLLMRRHVPELIDAFARLARERSDVRLDIVGDNRTSPRIDFKRLAQESGAGNRVTLRSYVSDDTLAGLYSRARVFVFLSEYEGFGLTPLEALSAGVPIVVLDTPVAREVYGDAALYLSAPDPALIQAALTRLLDDAAARERILAAAAALLPRYSWTRCASTVLRALERAAR
jgi:glycosyltransferase involved in cell wall biosynthesis